MADDIRALKKWKTIEKRHQALLLDNVFCGKCGVTTIVDYSFQDDQFGLIIKGKCKNCGSKIARYVEID